LLGRQGLYARLLAMQRDPAARVAS
jgi:hypothetical protein